MALLINTKKPPICLICSESIHNIVLIPKIVYSKDKLFLRLIWYGNSQNNTGTAQNNTRTLNPSILLIDSDELRGNLL